MSQIDEREILDVIRAIEAGTVAVTKSDPWDYQPTSIQALKRWGFDDDEARRCLKATIRERRPPT